MGRVFSCMLSSDAGVSGVGITERRGVCLRYYDDAPCTQLLSAKQTQ
jgi:hypothetical protein